MSRLRSIGLIVGLPVGAILIAVVLVLSRPAPPRTPPLERVPTVVTGEIRDGEGSVPVMGNGTVVPRAEVELAPQVAGRVASVSRFMVSGGRFQAGETLVQLDPADFENAVEQALAQVAQDSVALLQAEEEARIARDEFEQFRRREGSSADPSPLVLREPQLQAARATLARSKAQLATAELNLSRTRIRAPFAGVVRAENVDPGAFAAVGQSLGRIYASDAVEVRVPLTDGDAAIIPGLWELRPGAGDRSVTARVYSNYGDRRYVWEGFVDRVETALDEQSRTIDVVVQVPNPFRPGEPASGTESAIAEAPPLLVGQYVDVEIEGREGTFQVIPRRALRPGGEVWAVADSLVRLVNVDVLQQLQDSVFVVGDFRPGEAAILSGVGLATDGMKVRAAAGSAP